MENKINEVKPLAVDVRVMQDLAPRDAKAVTPVPKGEGSAFNKVSKDPNGPQREGTSSLTPEQTRDLTQNVQNYLSELDISLNFEVHETTGELVTKVVDPHTKKVIRQIPPEDVLKLHDTLLELRGVLFDHKA